VQLVAAGALRASPGGARAPGCDGRGLVGGDLAAALRRGGDRGRDPRPDPHRGAAAPLSPSVGSRGGAGVGDGAATVSNRQSSRANSDLRPVGMLAVADGSGS